MLAHASSSNALQVRRRPVGHVLANLAFVEQKARFLQDEMRIGGGEFPRGLGGIVPLPARLRSRPTGQRGHDAIGGHDVRTGTNQRRIEVEFRTNVCLRVARIEEYQYSLTGSNQVLHAGNRRGVGRASFDERDGTGQRVRFNRLTVVSSNLDVHTDDPPTIHRLAQAGVVDQRSTVRDPRFQNNIRLHAINHFLNTDQVFRQLNDWTTEPGKAIAVFLCPADGQPLLADEPEGFGRVEWEFANPRVSLVRDGPGIRVDGQAHLRTPSLVVPLHHPTVSQRPVIRSMRGRQPSSSCRRCTSATRIGGSLVGVSRSPRRIKSGRPQLRATHSISSRTAIGRPEPMFTGPVRRLCKSETSALATSLTWRKSRICVPDVQAAETPASNERATDGTSRTGDSRGPYIQNNRAHAMALSRSRLNISAHCASASLHRP